MDTDLLKTFLEVKNTRHFGKAAENLHLTQTAISARIKQLEISLGGSVFTRFRNNLQLTSLGEHLVPHAESILFAWEKAKSELALINSSTTEISIGTTNNLWDLFSSDFISTLFKLDQELSIKTESCSPATLIRHLLEKTLDFILLFEPPKVAGVCSESVTKIDLILVSSQLGQKLNDNFLIAPYIMIDWGASFEMATSHLLSANNIKPILKTPTSQLALDYIIKNGGSAYLPRNMIAPYLQKSLIIVDNAPIYNKDIFVCYLKQTSSSSVTEYLSLIKQAFDNTVSTN